MLIQSNSSMNGGGSVREVRQDKTMVQEIEALRERVGALETRQSDIDGALVSLRGVLDKLLSALGIRLPE